MMINSADSTLSGALAEATERALVEAELRLPPDVLAVLRRAAATERNEIARQEFTNILENVELARERRVPI
ncbi:MAG: fumarate hydratase, partial [Methanoculleus sp.]|nr:fumarate hydratase [Methanoculleus sp.]